MPFAFGDTLGQHQPRARRHRSEPDARPLRARADDQPGDAPRSSAPPTSCGSRCGRATAPSARSSPIAATRAAWSSATAATRWPTSRCAATSRTSSTRSARPSSPTAPSAAWRSCRATRSATPRPPRRCWPTSRATATRTPGAWPSLGVARRAPRRLARDRPAHDLHRRRGGRASGALLARGPADPQGAPVGHRACRRPATARASCVRAS